VLSDFTTTKLHGKRATLSNQFEQIGIRFRRSFFGINSKQLKIESNRRELMLINPKATIFKDLLL
jgi:hypothetical protein